MATQDFTRPAVNDETGHCVCCGRDNNGYEGEPCIDECPMYWEEVGLSHPEYPGYPVKQAA
jgi:hypothetical protein